jgi:hypothetical protein
LVGVARLSRRERGNADTAFALREAVAMAVLQDVGRLRPILVEVEDLLADAASYEAVMDLLEDLQNIASHQLDGYLTAEQVRAELGPRARVAWQSLNQFWLDVDAWSQNRGDIPDPPGPGQIRSVKNPDLQRLLTSFCRQVTSDRCIAVGHAGAYERTGQGGLPNFSHIDAVIR